MFAESRVQVLNPSSRGNGAKEWTPPQASRGPKNRAGQQRLQDTGEEWLFSPFEQNEFLLARPYSNHRFGKRRNASHAPKLNGFESRLC
jgi:hypothetical protein